MRKQEVLETICEKSTKKKKKKLVDNEKQSCYYKQALTKRAKNKFKKIKNNA